ncbi:MAG: pyridoxal phosphate-dependent aminotransferase [Eubacteriales bacterium]
MLSNKATTIKPSSTLAITAKAKKLKNEGIDVIGFGAGEPDFDTPEHIKEAAIKAIKEGCTKYTPASGIASLKQTICNKLALDNGLTYKPNQIVVSNGAKHSLTNTFMTILNPGDEVIIPSPFWLSYPQMVKLADGIPVFVRTTKEQCFKVSVSQLEEVVNHKTKAIIINSPSNPTGMIYSKEELKELADFALRNDLYVISDEIYEKLIYDDNQHVSIASLNKDIYDKTIVINGVSKAYAMTGWRIGYAACNEKISKLMSNIQSHATSNPNTIAQIATETALSNSQECVNAMVEEFEQRRNYMFERIENMPLISTIKPQGAFYLFVDISKLQQKIYKGKSIGYATDLANLLLEEENVAIIPCNDFAYDDHIRLSYAISLEQIKTGLDRIEKFLNKLL